MLAVPQIAVLLVAAAVGSSTSNAAARIPSTDAVADSARAELTQSYGRLPLSFEANHGQSPTPFKFLSRVSGYSVLLAPTEALFALKSSTLGEAGCTERNSHVTPCKFEANHAFLRMRLIGANPEASMAGIELLPGKVNHFVGRDSTQWRTNIPTFKKVRAERVYPGIDVVYHGNRRQLEYDFIVAPGADPASIRLTVSGAERLELDDRGDIVLHFLGEQLRMHRPLIYQELDGERREIPGAYALVDSRDGRHPQSVEIGFRVGVYDLHKPLVIDPVLSYSTYLGGSAEEFGRDIAVDASGSAYVVGRTLSTDFPTANPLQASNAGSTDAFIAKLDPSGSSLVYSTYLGGTGGTGLEGPFAVSVDTSGNAYLTGQTDSSDFPVTNPIQAAFGGGPFDAFLAKLDSTGSTLLYSTYLGGSDGDVGLGVAVQAAGNIHVIGSTASADFPTANAFQATFAGGSQDAFLTTIKWQRLRNRGSILIRLPDRQCPAAGLRRIV